MVCELSIAMLLLGLLGAPGQPADFPAPAEVVVEGLEVLNEPDGKGFVCQRLRRGERVTIRDDEGSGWVAIDPPDGSFCWIQQNAIEEEKGAGRARVVVSRAVIRTGLEGARLPGPPGLVLEKGAEVGLLKRPALRLGERTTGAVWRAIAPPSRTVRHVRAEGIRRIASAPEENAYPVAERLASYDPAAEGAIPPDVASEISRIEAAHRAILRDSVEQWRLETIRQRYQALLKGVTDSATGNMLRARLELVGRHEAMAESARTIQTLLDRSHRQDRKLALYQRRLAEVGRPHSRGYDAIGLIQPSSRKVNGRKVFALIGPDGDALAYLDVPPGLDTRPLVSHRVGVRGSPHFDESLRARLISVRDVETLDEP